MSLADSALQFSHQVAAWDTALEGATITLKGTVYAASVSTGSVQVQSEEGNITFVDTIIVGLSKALHANEPELKALVTYNNRKYRISEVWGRSATDAFWEMRCLRFD